LQVIDIKKKIQKTFQDHGEGLTYGIDRNWQEVAAVDFVSRGSGRARRYDFVTSLLLMKDLFSMLSQT
jgi:hypothetical protein